MLCSCTGGKKLYVDIQVWLINFWCVYQVIEFNGINRYIPYEPS
jgi:hypothetical protein